jgi:uncharacterized Rmd1/YagE family protein
MSSNKALRKAKHDAYEAKQEKKGKRVIDWIFIGLIILAVIFMIYSITKE